MDKALRIKKTFRVKMRGDKKIYRTDGIPTHCCSFDVGYFLWERNTKFNDYNGWSGYASPRVIDPTYNPDNLTI